MKHHQTRKVPVLALMLASFFVGLVLAGILDYGIPFAAESKMLSRSTYGETPLFERPTSITSLVKQVYPAVVSITSKHVEKRKMHPFFGDPEDFRWFFGPFAPEPENEEDKGRVVESGGSGFIITEDGYIVTNYHVVAEADELVVNVSEEPDQEEKYKAKIIGTDPPTDLALIKIEPKRALPTLPLGDSDEIEIGEWVIAVGFPLRYGKTVTQGIISGKGRQLGLADASLEDYLQTDAAINFGNSGGPLLNMKGQVVGVNTAISARGHDIGFAVPINTFKRIYKSLLKEGKVARGYLGVRIRNVDASRKEAFNLPDRQGAFVESVEEDTPAEEAGLKPGDVIRQVDDLKIKNTRDLINYISSQKPGEKVTLKVIREGKTMTLRATLTEREYPFYPTSVEAPAPQPEKKGIESITSIGIKVRNLNAALRKRYNIDDAIQGALIVDVKNLSPADEEGLREGDVITEANGKKVKEVEDLIHVVEKLSQGDYLRLYIHRPGKNALNFFAIIKLEE